MSVPLFRRRAAVTPKAIWTISWRRLNTIGSGTGAAILAIEMVAVLLLWQLLSGRLEVINPLFLPPPSAIVGGFLELLSGDVLAEAATASLIAWWIGYGLATFGGVIGGLAVGTSFAADRLTLPILWTLYAIPWLAYRPITKAWFGFGLGPVIFLVFIAAVFPILFNTSAGIRTTSRQLVNAGRIFGASKSQLYRKILLPSTVPYILAGMRQSVVLATIALIVAEMTGSAGMGYLIVFKSGTFETNQSFAVIVMVVIWSVGMSQLCARSAGRSLPGLVTDEHDPGHWH